MPPRGALRAEEVLALAADWRLEGYGARGRGAGPRLLKSVYLAEGALAERNRMLMRKYEAMRAETAWEQSDVDDAELVVVAFGSMARHRAQRHPAFTRRRSQAGAVPARDALSLPGTTPCAPWRRGGVFWSLSRTPARWRRTCA